MSGPVLTDRHGRVAVLTIDRPQVRNAWDVPTYRALTAAISDATADPGIGAMVLTGTGSVYCSGVDMKAPPEPADDSGRVPTVGTLSMARTGHWLELVAGAKPLIVALNGAAVGAGATHILAADIRLAAASATVRFPFLSLRTLPELGSSALLQRLIGAGRARELLLTGRPVGAQEALRIGLVSAVYPDDELLTEAIGTAARIASLPALQVQLTRHLLDDNADSTDAGTILQRENRAFITLMRSGRGDAAPAPSAGQRDPVPAPRSGQASDGTSTGGPE
jgi:enoyl-CoA hydratase/carnithine racemase